MEQQMKRAERMAALGTVADGVAHEIRNPLASISGSVELLRTQPQVGEDDRALMDIVIREIDRLNRLITDLLDYANPHPRERVTFDVALLLRETAQVFQRDRTLGEVALVVGVDAGEVLVNGDPGKLRQVLWNLLRNAAEAAAQGGTRAGGRVGLALRRGEGEVEIEVSDDGVGIPPDLVGKIFEPFFTTKHKGSGLGLATCHSIVTEHGGMIDVHSEPERGSRFVVRLPLAAAAPGGL
jgi:two-component system sensor histidine kinase PilS (NtrC family)